MRKLNYVFLLPLMMVSFVLCWCDRAEGADRILFIAHDNRPISMQQTAEVVEQAGYELVMPPEELLSRGENEPGNPEELWKWLDEKADSARAAVVSSDSMLYGGLIASHCDGALLVVRSGSTPKGLVANSIKQLELANCRLLGTVLNRVEQKQNAYYYRYSQYGYGYGYGYGQEKGSDKKRRKSSSRPSKSQSSPQSSTGENGDQK